MTAIILAGGLGSRLSSLQLQVPKPMAPVHEIPFLSYILAYLSQNGIKQVIIAAGYRHEVIINHYGDQFDAIPLRYSIEYSPLGTGGAVLQALKLCAEEEVYICNGDTFFAVDLPQMQHYHNAQCAQLTVATKTLKNFDRYGAIQVSPEQRILGFEEKKFTSKGQINGGIYIINRSWFLGCYWPEQFSFERDILEAYTKKALLYAFPSNGYFIDIGIPEDYQKAEREYHKLQ